MGHLETTFHEAGYGDDVAIVGGAVRDTLRGYPSHFISEIDLCVGDIGYSHCEESFLDFFFFPGPCSVDVCKMAVYDPIGALALHTPPSFGVTDVILSKVQDAIMMDSLVLTTPLLCSS